MLPALKNFNRFTRGVLGGWELTGIMTARSGSPITILAGKDQSGTGLNKDRGAQVAGADPFASGPCSGMFCVSYLNKAAFTQPDAGTFGTLGKGVLRGPNFFNYSDMQVHCRARTRFDGV